MAYRIASLTDLELDRLVVIYPGTRRYSLAEGVEVLPLVELANNMLPQIVKRKRVAPVP